MATANRTTSTFPRNATDTTNFRASYVTPLRNAFVSGGQIRAADLNLLRIAIAVFNGHDHGVIDYAAIREFGNNGPGTVIAANPRVSTIVVGQSTPPQVSAGAQVSATHFNAHATSVNTYRDHLHIIFDNPSA